MQNLKKVLLVMMAITVMLMCVGCGGSSSSASDSDSEEITSSSDAISAVKNYMSGTSFSTEQRIAGALGFNNFYDPKYGTSSASQNSDGSWDVEINGSMTGYVDEYHDDIETFKFTITATVSSDGKVSMSVEKVY